MKPKKIKQPVSGNKVAKVPVIMQLEALECGAACLSMVLAYYDKWIPLEQVRVDCGVSRDGSSAVNVIKAAKSYGLDAAGFRYEPEALKEEGVFPCIIHWNFNHFVVLDGFKGDRAYLNDPAKGDYSVSMETFDKSFTGICLMFEPTDSFQPSGKQKSMFSFAIDRLKGSGTAVAFVVLTTIISSLLGIINPVFSRIFLDRLLTGVNPEWVRPFLFGMAGIYLLQVISQLINEIYSLKINGKMAAVGNTSYMWKVLHLPLVFFSQRMAGDIISRQSTNASIAGTLVNTFAPLVLQSIMMVFYLVVMIRYSPLMALIGVLSILINTLAARLISRKRINISRQQTRDAGKLAGTTVAGMEMIETIKASGAENGFFRKWSGYQAAVNMGSIAYSKTNTYLGLIPSFISSLTNTAILGIGVFLTIQGEFTLGMITAFQGFLNSFTAPANTLISAGQTLMEMRTQMERVDDVMKYPSDFEEQDNLSGQDADYEKLSGDIEIRNVTFGYSPLGSPNLTDFSVTIKPGQSIALVGPSGCGKSTIAKLISGLYAPWSGEILFDGKPLSAIPRSVFKGSLAVVDQDIILFEDTVANNIKMWDESIEDFEMILAARDAQIHDVIMERDGGYNARLMEGGRNFSGGQRQRLEIARVLAQDPTIIIMDEATSALDAKTEYDVVKSIRDRGITSIVVAHRLSTIRDCDEIIVLDAGHVVERGTHAQLMEMGGYYTKLITSE